MKYQKLYNIAFSDKPAIRWKRHLLFWAAVFLYHVVRIGLMMPAINSRPAIISLLNYSFTWGVLPNIFVAYLVAYYLIPKYFNHQKYVAFTLGILLLILMLAANVVIRNFFAMNIRIRSAIGISNGFAFFKTFRPGLIRLFGNPPLICCLFLSIKTLKNWHLEQLKTTTLAKENANAELQLLKAQVHPHFLFNTLNNIYSFALTQSPQAGALVQKLSDMLNYMIHECEQPLVVLEKELKLIRDYIGLEKVRYGNRLDMEVEITGEYKNKLIAPLLMIPFVENCFKHGASIMRGQQWIKLSINISEDQLDFKLRNSKPPDTAGTNNKKGIGLANVQKRLQLLYPGKHFLNIKSSNDAFFVDLQVSLQQLPNNENKYELIPKLQAV
jgi:sensor histidine kinase YesM